MTPTGDLEPNLGNGCLSTSLRGGFVLFLIASALSLALLVVSLYVFVARINQEMELAHLQRGATDYIVQLNDVILGLQQIRGLGQVFLHGEVTANERMHNTSTAALTQIETLARNPLSQSLQPLPAIDDLRQQLIDREVSIQSPTDADDDFITLSDLISQLEHRILHRVGRQAALLVDPEGDMYDLSYLLINHIHPLTERIGQLRGRHAGQLAEGAGGNEQAALLLGYRFLVDNALKDLEDHWNYPEFRSQFGGKLAVSFQRASAMTREFMNQSSLTTDLPVMSYFSLGSQAIAHWSLLSRQIVERLNQRVDDRVARLAQERLFGSGIFVLTLLPLMFAMGVFYRRHRRALVLLMAQHQEMERLSQVDTLTGLYNRRPLADLFGNERRRALREVHGLVFAILDVDHFKHYNDHYGHLAGDEALVAVANAMREGLQRAGDRLFRLGGEEFCYLHSCSDVNECLMVAERLRKMVEEMSLKQGAVTVSVGVSYFILLNTLDLDRAIKSADEALYRAKNAGRNRVELIEEDGAG